MAAAYGAGGARGGVWGWLWLIDRVPRWAAVTVVAVVMVGLIAWGPSRRFVAGHAWCTVTRHRLRSCLVQSRVMNSRGYVPWCLWVRPTNVGERVWLLMRPGICAEDVESRTAQIAAACWARDARVRAWRRLVAVVLVDVIRRDPLAAGRQIGSPLTGLAGGDSVPAGVPAGVSSRVADPDGELGVWREIPPGDSDADRAKDWELGPDAARAVLSVVPDGPAHLPTPRVARKAHSHATAGAATPTVVRPVARPSGAGAVSSSGEDVTDYV